MKTRKKGARFGPGVGLAERTTWAILLKEIVISTLDHRTIQDNYNECLYNYTYILSGMSIWMILYREWSK